MVLLLSVGVFTGTAQGAHVPALTAFPVVGNVTYVDDFGDPRPGGPHKGNDVMSVRHQPAVAFEAGSVQKWPGSGGCMLVLNGRSGMVYWYIHLNNDRGPGNDNKGGCRNGVSFAPGLRNGQHVKRGQFVAYVGDSGDADGLQPHLHFEVHSAHGRAIDPYRFLRRSRPLLFPRPRSSQGDVALTLKGARVIAKTDSTITVRTKRVLVDPLGLDYICVRRVTLDTTGATVERKSNGGALIAADTSSARIGERARLTTPAFKPRWAAQRAEAGRLSASKLILFGTS
ncbi:MAG TPA: M23 family metallopeptidase [Gaiellaceae bacterium]